MGANLRGAFDAANAVAALGSNNKYFDIPQSVSSIFTGQESLLDELASFMFCSIPEIPASKHEFRHAQKRFVIYGLGGSGKTQFCCKFAQDNRQRFWGVFWIDGSSEIRAEQTFSWIAKTAGREPNDRAAKKLESFFPEGERGHILITTRNPLHKIHGTIGEGFFNFGQWDPVAARALLLKASNEPQLWGPSVLDLATKITKALGYLPLAVIVAGRTILKGLCTLRDYLNFYESNWKRVRQRAHRRKSDSSVQIEADPQFTIYVSCDVMYQSLQNEHSQAASDAIELLNVFSFLHRESISVKLLLQGATNPKVEQEHGKKTHRRPPKTWQEWFEPALLMLYQMLKPEPPRPILLDVLRVIEGTDEVFDVYRLREALAELSQRSLIMYRAEKDSYSIHPIVHTWVRERPEMKTADQAIWCRAAATIISQSILLPPLATSAADDDFRRELLPHLLSIRTYEQEIRHQFDRNKAERRRVVPFFQPTPSMNRAAALSMAKYSLVFTQCGLFEDALKVQLAAYEFLHGLLGPGHISSIRIMLALAGTYGHLGQGTQAADLQEEALKNSTESLGNAHPDTLRIMDSLDVSRWMQARFEEATNLHGTAIDGLTLALGSAHEDTLRAKDHLGRVESKYLRHERARELHACAAEGLKATLGEEHLDTLIAMENLAMTYLELGNPSNLALAQIIEEKVLAARTAKLGGEHFYTLWSTLNLARIRASRGDVAEAEAAIRAGLLIAYRNLGADHIGVLNGRTYLGWVQHLAGQTRTAIDELRDVIARQAKLPTAIRGTHPDRSMAMFILADCYQTVGRFDDGIALCAEAIKGIRDIGGQHHPFIGKLEEKVRDLSRERERVLTSVRLPYRGHN
ncbi:MAG: hypothetical protein Q9157_003344 [Trypethelium eluteriae]